MPENYLKRERFYWLYVLGDGILLAAAFLAALWIRRGNLLVETKLIRFLILLFVVWFLVTLFSRKYMVLPRRDFFTRLQPYWSAAIIQALFLSLLMYLFGWYKLPRFIVYGTIALHLFLENISFVIHNLLLKERKKQGKIPFSIFFFFIELVTIVASFLFIYYFRKETLRLAEKYQLVFLGVFFIWLLVSLLLHRFRIPTECKLWQTLTPFWKSEIVIVSIVSFFIFFTRQVAFSRTIILGSILLFAIVENMVVVIYFILCQVGLAKESEEFNLADELVQKNGMPVAEEEFAHIPIEKYTLPGARQISQYLKNKLQKVYLKKFEEIYQFIEDSIDLEKFDILTSVFLYARGIRNIEILEEDSLTFIFNLERVNEFRRINQMFIEVNRKLKMSGIYICSFESLEQRKERIYRKFPFIVARLFYPVDFFYKRIMPKLPLLRKFYFFISRGHNRALSKTECLGRLFYCGFDIIALQAVSGQYYCIARKIKEPSTDPRHFYGLFFRQKRIGKGDKVISIYKLRTMHPFADYLHRYIYERHQLDETGKIKRDFRITSWGRFFRRTWMDELPMLINLFRGDLKLVGVRPLSETFFASYPDDLKKERIKYKPGLIPPYYADMPKGIEEVWISERRYLERYKKHPLRTDLIYFFKALNNILFHHAKSS